MTMPAQAVQPGTRSVQCKTCFAMATVPRGTDPHAMTWCGCCTQDHHHGLAAAECSPARHPGGIATPDVPASGTPAVNSTGAPVAVTVSGGTVTAVAVNGEDLPGFTSGTVTVPAGGSVALTYTAEPVWTWALPCWNPPAVPKPDGCLVCRPVIHFAVAGDPQQGA